jgi:hypothetical protein
MMPPHKRPANHYNIDKQPEIHQAPQGVGAPKILTLNLADSNRSQHNTTTGNENVKSSECSSSGCYDAIPLVAHLQTRRFEPKNHPNQTECVSTRPPPTDNFTRDDSVFTSLVPGLAPNHSSGSVARNHPTIDPSNIASYRGKSQKSPRKNERKNFIAPHSAFGVFISTSRYTPI